MSSDLRTISGEGERVKELYKLINYNYNYIVIVTVIIGTSIVMQFKCNVTWIFI